MEPLQCQGINTGESSSLQAHCCFIPALVPGITSGAQAPSQCHLLTEASQPCSALFGSKIVDVTQCHLGTSSLTVLVLHPHPRNDVTVISYAMMHKPLKCFP